MSSYACGRGHDRSLRRALLGWKLLVRGLPVGGRVLETKSLVKWESGQSNNKPVISSKFWAFPSGERALAKSFARQWYSLRLEPCVTQYQRPHPSARSAK